MKIRTIKRHDKMLARKMKRFLERKLGRGVTMRQVAPCRALQVAQEAKQLRTDLRKGIKN